MQNKYYNGMPGTPWPDSIGYKDITSETVNVGLLNVAKQDILSLIEQCDFSAGTITAAPTGEIQSVDLPTPVEIVLPRLFPVGVWMTSSHTILTNTGVRVGDNDFIYVANLTAAVRMLPTFDKYSWRIRIQNAVNMLQSRGHYCEAKDDFSGFLSYSQKVVIVGIDRYVALSDIGAQDCWTPDDIYAYVPAWDPDDGGFPQGNKMANLIPWHVFVREPNRHTKVLGPDGTDAIRVDPCLRLDALPLGPKDDAPTSYPQTDGLIHMVKFPGDFNLDALVWVAPRQTDPGSAEYYYPPSDVAPVGLEKCLVNPLPANVMDAEVITPNYPVFTASLKRSVLAMSSPLSGSYSLKWGSLIRHDMPVLAMGSVSVEDLPAIAPTIGSSVPLAATQLVDVP